MRSLGIAHFSAIGLAPVAFARAAARAGFSSVGLRLVPAFPGAPFYELPAGSGPSLALIACLKGEGLQVNDIEFAVISPDFRAESLLPVLGDAAELGAKRLSVCGDDPDTPRLIGNFASLCTLAEGFGIAVDMENMGWRAVARFSDAVAVVKAAGQSNGGVLADALHFFRNGGEAADLRGCACLHHAQLCDAGPRAPVTPDEMIAEARGGRLPPGLGTLPLPEMLAALPRDVARSVEVPMRPGDDPDRHLAFLFGQAMALTS